MHAGSWSWPAEASRRPLTAVLASDHLDIGAHAADSRLPCAEEYVRASPEERLTYLSGPFFLFFSPPLPLSPLN